MFSNDVNKIPLNTYCGFIIRITLVTIFTWMWNEMRKQWKPTSCLFKICLEKSHDQSPLAKWERLWWWREITHIIYTIVHHVINVCRFLPFLSKKKPIFFKKVLICVFRISAFCNHSIEISLCITTTFISIK